MTGSCVGKASWLYESVEGCMPSWKSFEVGRTEITSVANFVPKSFFFSLIVFASQILTGHTNLLQIPHNIVHTTAMRSWSFCFKKKFPIWKLPLFIASILPSGNLIFYMSTWNTIVHSYRCCYKLLLTISVSRLQEMVLSQLQIPLLVGVNESTYAKLLLSCVMDT